MKYASLLIVVVTLGAACLQVEDQSTAVDVNSQHLEAGRAAAEPQGPPDPDPRPPSESEAPPEAPPEVAEALERDLQRLAKSRGWTIEQTRERHAITEALNRVLGRLVDSRPDIYVGGIAPAAPGDDAVLLIKGRADGDVRELVAQEAAARILIRDRQPYSLTELRDRQRKVHDSLTAMGYRSVATVAEIELQGKIRANVGLEAGMPDKAEDLRPQLPESLRGETAVTFMGSDAFRDEATWAGDVLHSTLKPNPLGPCTSGFTVRYGFGTRALLAAGHCTWSLAVDQIATQGGDIFSAFWVPGYLHIGDYGDWTVHEAETTHESRFNASPSETRIVWDVEDGPIATNTTLSFYSRREFDVFEADVQSSSFRCTVPGYPTVDRLVLMNNTEDISSEGDSGAAWFMGSTAYGVHKGRCPINDPDQVAFTPIRAIQLIAPNVQVTRWWEWW